MRRLSSILLVGLICLVFSSCSSGNKKTAVKKSIASPGIMQAPTNDRSFYFPPKNLSSQKLGEIIWSKPLKKSPENADGWKVLYLMEGVNGEPVAASALIYVPKTKAKHNIAIWAHSVTGIADKCAPSKGEFQSDLIPYFDEIISKGDVLVAPDYEGLGTPGLHPFLVGQSEGKAVRDSARMAINFKPANVKNNIVIYGHSQGGQAALFAGQLSHEYSPELKIRGIAAIAPVGDLPTVFDSALNDSSRFGYLVMGAVAYRDVYDDIDLTKIFSQKIIDASDIVEKECSDIVLGTYSNETPQDVIASPTKVDPWPQLLKENSPGFEPIPAPIFIIQGEKDETVPSSVSKQIAENLCSNGTEVQRIAYGGDNASHVGVVFIGQQDVLSFLEDRTNGKYFASDCG